MRSARLLSPSSSLPCYLIMGSKPVREAHLRKYGATTADLNGRRRVKGGGSTGATDVEEGSRLVPDDVGERRVGEVTQNVGFQLGRAPAASLSGASRPSSRSPPPPSREGRQLTRPSSRQPSAAPLIEALFPRAEWNDASGEGGEGNRQAAAAVAADRPTRNEELLDLPYPLNHRRLPTPAHADPVTWIHRTMVLSRFDTAADAAPKVIALLLAAYAAHGVAPVDRSMLSRRAAREAIRSPQRFGVVFDIHATRRSICTGQPHALAEIIYDYVEQHFGLQTTFCFVGISDSAAVAVGGQLFLRGAMEGGASHGNGHSDSGRCIPSAAGNDRATSSQTDHVPTSAATPSDLHRPQPVSGLSGGPHSVRPNLRRVDYEHLYIARPGTGESMELKEKGEELSRLREEEHRRRHFTPKYEGPAPPTWFTEAEKRRRATAQLRDAERRAVAEAEVLFRRGLLPHPVPSRQGSRAGSRQRAPPPSATSVSPSNPIHDQVTDFPPQAVASDQMEVAANGVLMEKGHSPSTSTPSASAGPVSRPPPADASREAAQASAMRAVVARIHGMYRGGHDAATLVSKK